MKLAKHPSSLKPGVRLVRLLLVPAILLLAGCAHRAEVCREAPRTDTGYESLVPPDSQRYSLAPGEDFEAPQLTWSTYPAYPAALIGPRNAQVAITARLVVNERGGVDRAMFDDAPGSDAEEPYRQAIREAVASWKFTPLRILHVARNGNGDSVAEKTARPCSLWYRFRFLIQDGRPTSEMREQPAP